ncbi:MAG: prenyltransferase/squalene oxidase repeat-containing protein, partial [Kiritimatiellia bacterium]
MKHQSLPLLLVILLACVSTAADVRPRPELITPEVEAAIQKGLAYLARTQKPDGSWIAEGQGHPVTLSSLACLALMCSGSTPTTGPYADNVGRGVEFLLRACDADGAIASADDRSHVMHGHGFAMLTLAHAYGMEANPLRQKRIAQVLQKAVRLTAASQSKDGGWYYSPNSGSDEGSVTVTQIQGLRACRDAGIRVPPETIRRACDYIQKCANSDGGISYSLSARGNSLPAITAASVATMYNAGQFEHPVAAGALKYVENLLQRNQGDYTKAFSGHSYYSLLYLSQAMWFAGDRKWQAFFPAMRDKLLTLRNADGAWQGDGVGLTFGT